MEDDAVAHYTLNQIYSKWIDFLFPGTLTRIYSKIDRISIQIKWPMRLEVK